MKLDDGTCEHYGRVDYVHCTCMLCYMVFLACPLCKPRHCPDCRGVRRVMPLDIHYCKAKAKSLARVRTWKIIQKIVKEGN
jgi:hypothetical protein